MDPILVEFIERYQVNLLVIDIAVAKRFKFIVRQVHVARKLRIIPVEVQLGYE